MLANGAKLEMAEKGSTTYENLPGLKEIPEMGTEPEKVENTCLTDKVKQYENGIGDAGEMAYKFVYNNQKPDSPYRKLRKAQESGKTYSFRETLIDGTQTEYDGQPSVKRSGGGVNGVIEFDVKMALQSEIKIIDPETTPAKLTNTK